MLLLDISVGSGFITAHYSFHSCFLRLAAQGSAKRALHPCQGQMLDFRTSTGGVPSVHQAEQRMRFRSDRKEAWAWAKIQIVSLHPSDPQTYGLVLLPCHGIYSELGTCSC
jgi:hypothetical protein